MLTHLKRTGMENILQDVEQLHSFWSMVFSSLAERTVQEVRFLIRCPERFYLLNFFFAENDERQNCCTGIYHHGPAIRHYGFGEKDVSIILSTLMLRFCTTYEHMLKEYIINNISPYQVYLFFSLIRCEKILGWHRHLIQMAR